MKGVDRVLLDTNLLLAATDEGRAKHHMRALAALNDWPAAGTALYASGQVLREYLVVATRAIEQNGLGLDREDALANVAEFRSRLRVLEENAKVLDTLLDLVNKVGCTGKPIHDANIVATAVAHGIAAIASFNTGDFVRFEPWVSVIDPARA